MQGRLADKAAVITGAGSGIGRAMALRFAAEGAAVAVNDVLAERAEQVAKEIVEAGGRSVAIAGDVGEPADVDALAAQARDAFGRVDIWVNNAAAPLPGLLAETNDEVWRQVHRVTLDGTFHGIRAALGAMRGQPQGSIINISSGAGLRGQIGLGAYGAAKAAVVNLTQTAAVENARAGIRVNAICPGAIGTPPFLAWVEQFPGGLDRFERQIPLGRIGRPDEIAQVALFLASDESSYVTGAVFVADGGVAAVLGSPGQPEEPNR